MIMKCTPLGDVHDRTDLVPAAPDKGKECEIRETITLQNPTPMPLRLYHKPPVKDVAENRAAERVRVMNEESSQNHQFTCLSPRKAFGWVGKRN